MKTNTFSLHPEDCTGYFQVYLKTQHGDSKLGNIFPPGYKLFDTVQDPKKWVVNDCQRKPRKFMDLKSALAWLIKSQGSL